MPLSENADQKTCDIIAVAQQVLGLEAKALEQLSQALGYDREGGLEGGLEGGMKQSFRAAVSLMHQAKGRVVLTGMGKSGHVGHKIAATLASTGTVSFFVHPGEASHGDLGMITQGDVVIALSNSGETAELSDIIAYSRRFSIPLIAMTRRADSSLAKAADVALVLPNAPEACPMGLAPTTSTTMMLALGDALAVALIEQRGFSANDFQLFHPGGSLGNRLQLVADLMHDGEQLPLIPPEAPMSQALLAMTEKRFGCVGVQNDHGALIGIVTDGDLRRHMASDLLEQRVQDVMTKDPLSIRPKALAAEALAIMNTHSITSLFVVDHTQPVGILHIHDCLRAGVA